MPGQRSVRHQLWRDNPHCYWCGVLTVFTGGRETLPPNAATIDHVYPRQLKQHHKQTALVNACLECNQRRNREWQEWDNARRKGVTLPRPSVWPERWKESGTSPNEAV